MSDETVIFSRRVGLNIRLYGNLDSNSEGGGGGGIFKRKVSSFSIICASFFILSIALTICLGITLHWGISGKTPGNGKHQLLIIVSIGF